MLVIVTIALGLARTPQLSPVDFTGAQQVWLVRGDDPLIELPAKVPAGEYLIVADFGTGPHPSGTVSVDGPTALTCNDAFGLCAAEGAN